MPMPVAAERPQAMPSVYGKRAGFVVHTSAPFNGGPSAAHLALSPTTPAGLFFVRNHGDVPQMDPAHYRLAVRGRVSKELRISLRDLQTRFRPATRRALLQCAGLRRAELRSIRPIPLELPWDLEPLGVAEWTGVPLADLLEAAGLAADAKHVEFTGRDRVERNGSPFGFGGSIPMDKALTGEVLLAYAMNGQPLAPVHGFPLRAVVPGYIGARSVKWLAEVNVLPEPSRNYFQTSAYKILPAMATPADWLAAPPIGEFPINSAICTPLDGSSIAAGLVRLTGYAFAQGPATIAAVDLLVDGTRAASAHFLTPAEPWTWRHWEAELTLAPGDREIAVAATDSAGHRQPAEMAPLWNAKGYLNNAWHRIRVKVG